MFASERSGSSTIETQGKSPSVGGGRRAQSRPRNRPPPPFGAGQLPSDRWANDDPSLPQTARSRPHRMAGIRSIGGGRPPRRGLLPREWMDPSASPRGSRVGDGRGVLGLPVRGPRETPSVRPELSNCLICRRLVRPAPQSQPACCNAQTAANNAFAFRLRCKVPRRGDTPQPGRGNVLLDKMHST